MVGFYAFPLSKCEPLSCIFSCPTSPLLTDESYASSPLLTADERHAVFANNRQKSEGTYVLRRKYQYEDRELKAAIEKSVMQSPKNIHRPDPLTWLSKLNKLDMSSPELLACRDAIINADKLL